MKELLCLVRTGSLGEAKERVLALGAPEPALDANWSADIGSQFLRDGRPANRSMNYIRFITIAAEIYDQFGTQHLSRQALKSRGLQTAIDRDLQEAANESSLSSRTGENWRLLRQKLYFWLQVSRSAYRYSDLEYARECVSRCRRIAQEKLHPPSDGLAADLSYRLAAIARQQFKLDEAIHYYGECLTSTFALLKRKQEGSNPLSAADALAARYLIGKSSALGLGYCFIEKGMLREARVVITAGEMLLWETRDWLNLQYCELLFARVLRHEAGRDPKGAKLLNEAKEILTRCVRMCGGNHRARFVYRVHYELGFVELYSGRFEEGESNFKKVVDAADKDNDLRWKANGMIAVARLRLYQGKAAGTPVESEKLFNECLSIAIDAEAIAKHAKHAWAQARCILMQARAEMSLATMPSITEAGQKELRDAARTHLRHVLEMTELSNPAVRALPLILLARLYRSEGDIPKARGCFEAWVAIRDQVQYTAIQALGKEVEQEVFSLKGDFVVSAKLPDDALNKEQLTFELERYIFNRLEARTDLADKERAKMWGGVRSAYLRRRKQIIGY